MEANTMTERTGGGISLIENLAMQAQMFSCGAAMNLLQLGRVLTEARPLVRDGEWIDWVQENAHLPIRRAQEYMQAYQKFGIDQRIAQLGPSQIIALLPMTDEERETLMAENNVGKMTVRELKEVIRGKRQEKDDERREPDPEEMERMREEIRAEEREKLEAEQARVRDIQERAANAEMQRELDEALADARKYQAEMERLADGMKETVEASILLRGEKARQEAEIEELEELLREQQEEINRTNTELLNLKSAQARGRAELAEDGEELTPDAFSRAVRAFMGAVARMPYMSGSFAVMEESTRKKYREMLETVEGWAEAARQALESYSAEGGVM